MSVYHVIPETTHKATVIEVYPEEGKAAVAFRRKGVERVECVGRWGLQGFRVGDKGKIKCLMTALGTEWVFEVQS